MNKDTVGWTGPKEKPSIELRLPDVAYNPAPRIERMVFVCGLHRSGTTMVEQAIVSRFDVSCLRGNVQESEGQHLQGVYPKAKRFGGPGRFAYSDRMDEVTQSITDYRAARAQLVADWSRFVVGTSPVLVEKSPPNLTKIGWLRSVFPGAVFAIVVRDPRAVAAATQKWVEASLPDLMMHWNVAHAKAMRDMDPADCHVIRYEDFCADPEGQLAAFGQFARLPVRQQAAGIDTRFSTFVSSNADYIAMHSCKAYGPGAWNHFGYEV